MEQRDDDEQPPYARTDATIMTLVADMDHKNKNNGGISTTSSLTDGYPPPDPAAGLVNQQPLVQNMRRRSEEETQDLWRIHSKTSGLFGQESQRLENMSWRLMAMRKRMQQAKASAHSVATLAQVAEGRTVSESQGPGSTATTASLVQTQTLSIDLDNNNTGTNNNFQLHQQQQFYLNQFAASNSAAADMLLESFLQGFDDFDDPGADWSFLTSAIDTGFNNTGHSLYSSSTSITHNQFMQQQPQQQSRPPSFPPEVQRHQPSQPTTTTSSAVADTPLICHHCQTAHSELWHKSTSVPVVILCHRCILMFSHGVTSGGSTRQQSKSTREPSHGASASSKQQEDAKSLVANHQNQQGTEVTVHLPQSSPIFAAFLQPHSASSSGSRSTGVMPNDLHGHIPSLTGGSSVATSCAVSVGDNSASTSSASASVSMSGISASMATLNTVTGNNAAKESVGDQAADTDDDISTQVSSITDSGSITSSNHESIERDPESPQLKETKQQQQKRIKLGLGQPLSNHQSAASHGAGSSSTTAPASSSRHRNPSTAPTGATGEEVCNNCQTTVTPLWRRHITGETLCNACGLYFKLHHKMRPISMKTDVIKKRTRVSVATADGKGRKRKVSQNHHRKASVSGAAIGSSTGVTKTDPQQVSGEERPRLLPPPTTVSSSPSETEDDDDGQT